jgi:predicted transcriptional regulator of viral defense system
MSLFAFNKLKKMRKETVKEYVDRLQSRGRYSFEKKEIIKELNISPGALKKALSRLEEKNRIVMIRRRFYAVVPLEYRESGILPPSWFIHQLMDVLNVPYYVGLLSAAALEGAAHQQPQQFQVVTETQIRPILVKGLSIKFILKKDFPGGEELKQLKTRTGYMWVSEPELTAIDLLHYVSPSGGMNHVSTILLELGEKIRVARLARTAKNEKKLVYVQRLGYILDQVGHNDKTVKLAQWIQKKSPGRVLLYPGKPKGNASFNEKWFVFVNRELEVDEL